MRERGLPESVEDLADLIRRRTKVHIDGSVATDTPTNDKETSHG